MNSNLETLKKKYLIPILGNADIKRSKLNKLKNECSFDELCKVTDNINSNHTPYIYIFGNALPKSYETLGELDKKKFLYSADELSSEINWTILSIRRFKTEINLFLEYKRIFDDAFILAEYKKCEDILSKIENEICYSIWSLEKRFLLLEFSKSPEAHKTFLSEFNKINKGFFTTTLAHYISTRCEKNFSVLKYNTDINSLLRYMSGDLGEANRQYYYLKLNTFEKEYYDFKNLLAFENFNSIIDRYLNFIKVSKILLTTSDIDEQLRKFYISRLTYLIKNFQDPELNVLLVHLQPASVKDYKDESLSIKILDLYTSGLYEEAIEQISIQIRKYPNRFEYYFLLVKSYILCQKEFKISPDTSFQTTILNELYTLAAKLNSPQIISTNITRLYQLLNSFGIGDGLFAVINNDFYNKDNWKKFNSLSLSIENPIISEYLEQHNREKYLNAITEKYPSSPTVQLLMHKQEGNFEANPILAKLPENKRLVELAKYYQRTQKYLKASQQWESLVNLYSDIPTIYEISIRNLFECYNQLKQFDKAIKLYVDSYLKNEFVVQRINCNELFKIIKKEKFKNVSPCIELPIFYSINNANETETHIAYMRFNAATKIEKPTELFAKENDIDTKKLVIFYFQTCTTEIFKHSIFINGSKEGYTERIAICRHLMSIDPANEQTYKRELDSLTELIIIQEGLQQLDESKIYVNEQGLISNELKDFEGLFDRYSTIANILKDDTKQLVFFQKDGILATIDSQSSENDSELNRKFSSHPLKDFFKDIFDVITDKFLNSKFGIAAYLSTRIRHGVLLGEIRPIFEKYYLISQKNASNEFYGTVEFWEEKYFYLDEEKQKILQNTIANLSEEVDNLIFTLIKNKLQIKIGKENPKGWFDYLFDDTELVLYALKYSKTKDYQEFIRNVLEILWERTDRNLEKIRGKIKREVKDKFTESLNNFSATLKNKFGTALIPEVYTNTIACSTEVQNAFDKIASWFNRSGSQTSDFNIDKIINIVVENVNHSYQTKQISLTKNINTDIIIKGEYYSHIADLFRIFFDNALKHSDDEVSEIQSEISVDKSDNLLNIIISNNNPKPNSIKGLPKNKDSMKDSKLSSEGKSGIYKARKILQSDLKNEQNIVTLKHEDDKIIVQITINIDNIIYENSTS